MSNNNRVKVEFTGYFYAIEDAADVLAVIAADLTKDREHKYFYRHGSYIGDVGEGGYDLTVSEEKGSCLADSLLGDMPDIKDWPEAEREKMRGYLDGTYNPPLYPDD